MEQIIQQQPTGYWTQTYTNDAARRLRSVTSPAGTFVYDYLGASRLWTNLGLPNSVSITNRYDALARLTGTGLLTSGGVVTNSHRYLYDVANQRTNQVRTTNDYVNYTCDPLGQLRSAQGYDAGGNPYSDEQLGYRCDAAWNLWQRTNNGSVTTFQVNNLNQLTNNDGSYTACTYDDNGNLLTSGYAGYSPTYTFEYDDENQLGDSQLLSCRW